MWLKKLKEKILKKSKEERLAYLMGFPKTKVCTKCNKRKNITEYYFLPSRMVYRSACKSCCKESSKEWYKSENGRKYKKDYTEQGKSNAAFKKWRGKNKANKAEHRKRNLKSYRKREKENIKARILKCEAKIKKWKCWLMEIDG